ncbi:NADP-dependent oxidoreductase domain-containing protein [Lineolata rhizophorae]|uniref:NADP-dependent oxidoreductase domain-containing protein n=1 Tax=Lineolata rhizophorae TaxID=578093 RepID=A0A6A6P8H3_9PEZI|nr:NADP-dependent oxidoreductase domain-containing protein [Lineolata rhizophorae]
MDTRFTLNNGTTIPALGLGTWQSSPGEVKNAVAHALKVGYKHIDCAFCYQNEDEVGEGLKEAFAAGVKREDIFITTKLWCTFHSRVEENLNMSLKSLGLDYVDLYLMHWPVPMNPHGNHPLFPKLPDGSRDLVKDWNYVDTYKQMEKLLSTGKVKAIGVANHSRPYLENLVSKVDVVPAVNQIENHPYLPQEEVVDFCHSKGIHVTAYSPFGSTGGPLMQEEGVQNIAQKHAVSAGTVLLSYNVARGNSVLPKSVTPSRIEENKNIIKLDQSEVDELNEIHKKKGITRYVYPPFGVSPNTFAFLEPTR